MDKFSWSFSQDVEFWYASGKTVEDCIAQAEAQNADDDCANQFVYIGENVVYEPYVNAETVLEWLCDQAWDQCEEAAESWEPYDIHRQDELDELSNQLSDVVIAWLKKVGREPDFYSIQRVRRYPLSNYRPAEQEEQVCQK